MGNGKKEEIKKTLLKAVQPKIPSKID